MSNENRLSRRPRSVRSRSARTVRRPFEPAISVVTRRPDGPRSTTRMSVSSPRAKRLKAASSSCPGLVDLPHRQPRKAVGRRIRKVDPVDQHPDGVCLRRENPAVRRQSTSPVAIAQTLVADALVDRGVPTEREHLRLAVHQEPHCLPVPGDQDALLPFEGALLVDEPEEQIRGGQRACRRQEALLGHKRQIGRGDQRRVERLPDERRQGGGLHRMAVRRGPAGP